MKLMNKVAGIFLLLAIFGVRVSAQELSLFGPLPISPRRYPRRKICCSVFRSRICPSRMWTSRLARTLN